MQPGRREGPPAERRKRRSDPRSRQCHAADCAVARQTSSAGRLVLVCIAAVVAVAAVVLHTTSSTPQQHQETLQATGTWSLARCVREDVTVPVIDDWNGSSGGSFYAAVRGHRSLVRRRTHGREHSDSAPEDSEKRESGGGPVPVLLRRSSVVMNWPAASLWRSPEYLASRPVPHHGRAVL